MATFEFKLPDIGEGVVEGEIVKWMVKEGDDIRVPLSVQPHELCAPPLELHRIGGDVRVEGQNESVAVAERIRGIPGEPASRAVRRNEIGHGAQVVGQSLLASRIVELGRAGDVVVPGGEKVRQTAIGCEPIDEADEAHVPLPRVTSVHHRIPALQDELHR